MPFKKGESGNPLGRSPGSKNKASEAIRERVEDFLSEKIQDLDEVYNVLEPKEKAMLITKLLDFSLPKLKAIDSSISLNSMEMQRKTISDLFPSDEEIINSLP